MGALHDKRTFELPLAEPSPQPGLGQRETDAERLLRLFGPAPEIVDLHPSAATLEAVRAMRERHFANGHTPERDASEHGPLFFREGAHEFLQRAEHARSPEKARRHRIAAIAMLVAMLDREDFLQRQTEDATDERPLG